MSIRNKSLLSIEGLTTEDIVEIFSRAELFKRTKKERGHLAHLFDPQQTAGKVMAAVFLEPSTRTRGSFMVAAERVGIGTVNLVETIETTSIEKGESFTDTLETVAAMEPDLLVVRYGNSIDIDQALQKLSVPVINGGSGTQEHPTQALLDAFTIQEMRGQVEGERVLIVGDILHSRVANSNLRLLRQLGAEVAICGPEKILPSEGAWSEVVKFSSVEEGIKWATACMVLRVQRERHTTGQALSLGEYIEQYRIDSRGLSHLVADGIVMHPGPHVLGVEISGNALADKRCVIRRQVTNGVYVRAAIISLILGLDVGE